MDVRSLLNSTLTAFIAQGVSVVLSIIQSLLIPKILGVDQFGYWQLFIFYASYVGIFHLGLTDGMYLINGGLSRANINKQSITSQFATLLIYESVFAIAIIAFAFCGFFGEDRSFVLCCTGVYLFIQNAAWYLGYVFQAINETRLFSYSTIIERLSFLAPLIVLLAIGEMSFRMYVIAYLFSSICQLCYCCWHFRDFFHAGLQTIEKTISDCGHSIRVGVKLMIANTAGILIIGISRFVIDAFWDIQTFGKLSLSISLVGFFLAFATQASMVLFPALRQSDKEHIISFFAFSRDAMGLLFPLFYLIYYPLTWVLGIWLPEYLDSFIYLILLMPICIFDAKMNISCSTYFKVMRKEKTFLIITLAALAFSVLGSLAGAYIFNNAFFVIGTMVIAIVGRDIFSEFLIGCETDSVNISLSIAELSLSVIFIISSFAGPKEISFFVFLLSYAIYLFLFRSRLVDICKKILSLKRKEGPK